jgi:hypothetical protein
VTGLRHRWENDPERAGSGPVQQAVCERCGIRKRTRYSQGGGIPLVEYLVSGVGWIQARAPECVDTKQLSLLPPAAEPETEPAQTSVVVHKCHALDCAEPVHPRFLMCRRHWWMVPQPVRELVNSTYQHGQERGKVRPSREWVAAVRLAIAAVAELEGKAPARPSGPPPAWATHQVNYTVPPRGGREEDPGRKLRQAQLRPFHLVRGGRS